MTDKNRREEYDEIIRMSIEMSKENEDEFKELTDEDVIKMGYDLPPDDMYDRIIKAANETPIPKKKNTVKKVFLLAAVIAVTFIAGMLITSGVKHYSFDIDGEVTENAIKFRGTNKNDYVYEANESAAYEDAEQALGTPILKPTYLPEGIKFDTIKTYPNDYIILRYKNEKKSIKLKEQILRENAITGKISDEDYGNLYTFTFNENIVTVGEQIQIDADIKWLKAVWEDEKFTYTINTNCNKEELEEFIKNLK